MPYEIRKYENGFKVCKKGTNTCFSNDPIPLKNAVAQRKAIGISESGGGMSGGSMIIKAPQYGKIEIGIPNMELKNKLVNSLTKLKSLSTRKNIGKSVILEEYDGKDIIVENDGEVASSGNAVKFHSIRIKVPRTLIKKKQLKKKEKEVEVPTLTEKSKNLTTRQKVKSIKFKNIDGVKVKVIGNDDNVNIVYSGEQPSSVQPEPKEDEPPELEPVYRPSRVIKPTPPKEDEPPELETVYRPSRIIKPIPIPSPKDDYEKEINKLIKFSLGNINFDEFSKEMVAPLTIPFKAHGSTDDLKELLFMYYMALKYKSKMTLMYCFSEREWINTKYEWRNFFNIINYYVGKSHEVYIFPRKKEELSDLSLKNGKKLKIRKELIQNNKIQINSTTDEINYHKGLLLTSQFDTMFEYKQNDLMDWYIENIKKIIDKSDKQLVIDFNIGDKTGGHANLLLIRPKSKEVYILDPHGLQEVPKYAKKGGAYEKQKEVMHKLAQTLGYNYIPSGTVCPYIQGSKRKGFQALENIFQYQEKAKGSGESLKGFCGYWTFFIMELALQQPDKSMRRILQDASQIFTDNPEKVFNLIVKYQASISSIINEIARSEGLNLPKGIEAHHAITDYKEANIAKFIQVVSNNITRLYYLQNEMLGYGETEKRFEKLIFPTEDFMGSGLSGGDFFDDEDWGTIVSATKTGGDFDWWGLAKDLGKQMVGDEYKPVVGDIVDTGKNFYVDNFGTEEQKEEKRKVEEACKICKDGKTGGARPFFGRMGGKSKLANKLIAMFPTDYKTFVEPFVGAGNVFWRLDHKPDIKYVINDADDNVIKVFQSLKRGDKCLEDAGGILSKEEFNKLREKKNKTGCEQATFVRNSFFSMGKSYSYAKDLKKYEKKRLEEAKEILKNTTILNMSFEKVIKKYDSATTFFYLDPPYESETQKDYDDYVTPEQVYNGIKNIKGRFMISYNDSPNIRKVFKDYNIQSTKTEYAHTQHITTRKIGEVIITNYATKTGGDFYDDEDWSELVGGNALLDAFTPRSMLQNPDNSVLQGLFNQGLGWLGNKLLGGAIPINKNLYEKAKEIVYPQYEKPSAYRSGAVIKKYKELGGKFKEDGVRKLKRWFQEEWKDIGNKAYPVYRPTKKISEETPLTPEEIDPENLKLQIKEKQKIRGEKNLKPFEKKGGICPLTGLIPCKCPLTGGALYAKDPYATGEKELTPIEKKKVKEAFGEGNPAVQEVEREPMGDDDIKKYFPQAKILKYSELKNYTDIKQLLPRPKSFFFLLYERDLNVGHWVLLSRYKDNGIDTVEFFCSYGSKIDEPLSWTPIGKRVQLGEDKPYLSNLLNKSNLRIVYNPVQYQSKKSHIATCGAYDTLRAGELQKHNTTLEEFNDMLREVKDATGLNYDEIVSNLVDMR